MHSKIVSTRMGGDRCCRGINILILNPAELFLELSPT